MENQPSNDPGAHPQVPPAEPPDQGGQQNKEVPVVDSHVHEIMSEDTSEDEPPMVEALEEQPTATTTKNGVSQPTNFASKFAKGLARTAKNVPEGVTPNPKFLKKKGQDLASRSVNPQKSRNLEKQAAAAEHAKGNADKKQINELIEAIKILAQEQYVDNQKIESRTEENGQLIKALTEEVKKSTRSMADFARLGDRFDGFLKANQSPTVRRDSKRQKRVRDQSPQSETTDLERGQTTAPAPAVQTAPLMGAASTAAPPQCGPTRNRSEERQSRYHDNGPKRHAHTQTTRSSKLWPGPRIPQPQVLHQDPQALAPLVRDRTKNLTVTKLEHATNKTRTPMRPPPYLASTCQAGEPIPKTIEEQTNPQVTRITKLTSNQRSSKMTTLRSVPIPDMSGGWKPSRPFHTNRTNKKEERIKGTQRTWRM